MENWSHAKTISPWRAECAASHHDQRDRKSKDIHKWTPGVMFSVVRGETIVRGNGLPFFCKRWKQPIAFIVKSLTKLLISITNLRHRTLGSKTRAEGLVLSNERGSSWKNQFACPELSRGESWPQVQPWTLAIIRWNHRSLHVVSWEEISTSLSLTRKVRLW